MSDNVEFIDEKQEKKEPWYGSLKDVFNGTLLTRKSVVQQLPYVIFLTVLAIFYIGNRFRAEKIVLESIILQNELKELRAESITTTSQLMYASRQSEVVKLLKENGIDLQESLEPPKKIVDK